jgi:hypothetical protein
VFIKQNLSAILYFAAFHNVHSFFSTMPQLHLPTHEPDEEEEKTNDEQTNLTHLVSQVVVQLQYTVTIATNLKKGKSTTSKHKIAKKKLETKTKDFPFTFEVMQANYLAFLSALLEKHRYQKYTPVTTQTRFNIKAIVPPNKV